MTLTWLTSQTTSLPWALPAKAVGVMLCSSSMHLQGIIDSRPHLSNIACSCSPCSWPMTCLNLKQDLFGNAGLYRNNMTNVQKFLKEKHQANGYCVYNLCTEEHFAYKPSKFEMVANFPFDDHQVCKAQARHLRKASHAYHAFSSTHAHWLQ